MKLISLFNHKGGVSKTTTAFNLGWMLAEKGHKTLLVDADPQCNLTALVLDYKSIDDIEDFYTKNPVCDVYSGVEPVMAGRPGGLRDGNPVSTGHPNLHICCGNLKLSEAETQIGVAISASQSIPAIRNIPGSIGYFLRKTANEHSFDYVLIDMSPSVGALNQCLLMASNYFIVPTSPDFFCMQAIQFLSNVIPRWDEESRLFRLNDLDYSFPANPPKFLGFISQRYRPRSGAPARSFQRWIDVICCTVNEKLVPALELGDMSIKLQDFNAAVRSPQPEPFNLANIADFNSLIGQSQKHNVPVFALTDTQIEQGGVVLENMRRSREEFKKVFDNLADDVLRLTQLV